MDRATQQSLFETRPVKQERTGWRDAHLSERHRSWGWDCPALDLDFLMLEYDHGRAVALVEYKGDAARPQYPSHPSYRALIDFGNRAGIPVFGVRYATDFAWWRVSPLNAQARAYVQSQETMSERECVTLLYHMKGLELPAGILEGNDVQI